MPFKDTFRGLDTKTSGLVALDQEIFMGFVFVRFAPGLPSVREMAAPYLHEFEAYRMEELVPQGRVTLRTRHVNWKNVADNYSDGLHITVAHPGLTRLFGNGYGIEAQPWIDKMWGALARCDVEQLVRSGCIRSCCLRCLLCHLSGSGCGRTSSSGRTSRSTSIRTRSTSCSSCPSRRPKR